MIFSEIFKMSVLAIRGTDAGEYLPLEICSLAEYLILIDAIWPDHDIIKQQLAFTFLPGAIMALLFPPTISYPVINAVTFRFFLFHGSIAAYVIARFAAGEVKPRYGGLWMSLAICFVIAVLMQRFDMAHGYNFMFMNGHYDNPVLKLFWDVSGGNGGIMYILALAVFAAAVMHIAYFIYRLADKRGKVRSS